MFTWCVRTVGLVVLLVGCAAVRADAPAQETPARTRVVELEKALAEARAALDAAKTLVEKLEAQLAEARQAAADERIERARSGDPAALREFLDGLDDGVSPVELRCAKAVTGKGVDSSKVVRAIGDKWSATGGSASDGRLKAKLCWLLGRNGSIEAAAQLRTILASEKDPNLLANAMAALRHCPRSPADGPALRSHAEDTRKIAYVIGDSPRSLVLGDYARDILTAWEEKPSAAVPGELVADATFVCAGFEWRIEGDANRNCTVQVAYRKRGEAAWRPAQPLMRVKQGIFNDYKQDAGNLLAGSIFFLSPGTPYEVRLSLEDPDGGKDERTVTVTTRVEPEAAADAPVYHVSPGDGGGAGTKDDPFRGLKAAQAASKPGDVFLLGPGTYSGSFVATKDGQPDKPIVWRGSDAAKVIIDGGGTERIVNFNGRKHLFLEGVTVVNGHVGVAAMNTEGVVVRRCVIRLSAAGTRNGVGVLASGRTRDLVVSDNFISLGTPWEKRKNSSWGVTANGTRIVICHNHITDVWDGVSLASDDPKLVTSNVDVYGNFFERCTDDGVEADYVRHNVRVFRNRIVNCGSGLSSQPCFGGPTYYLFNDIYNCRIKPYKYHVGPTGILAFHNTSVCSRQGWNGGDWRHVKHRNNLVLGNLSPTVDTLGVGADLDYDGYNRTGDLLFRLARVGFRDLEDLAAAGLERHGIMVSLEDFVKAPAPHHPEWTYEDGYGAPYAATDADLRLKPTSKAVDAGEVLANINDDFSGKAPDLGCYELGRPLPQYGPRPAGAAAVNAP